MYLSSIFVRSRSWATNHPGFLSGYSNFGQRDFTVADGKLTAAMNTAESKAFQKQWVQMIQESGPKNWSTYTWYQVGTDLGAGASAVGNAASNVMQAATDGVSPLEALAMADGSTVIPGLGQSASSATEWAQNTLAALNGGARGAATDAASLVRPTPATAKLAYLMLASLGV